MSRKRRPLVALALVALISAGCGSDAPSDSDTASGGATAPAGKKKATGQDNAVKFSECMRAHGVPDFPDPNAKGEFEYGVSVSVAVWKKALNACKNLQPPGSLSAKRSPKEQTASLKFAQCIRENGVKDFPDPVNGEPIVNTYKLPSSNRPGGMAILNAAMQKCGDVGAEAMRGQ